MFPFHISFKITKKRHRKIGSKFIIPLSVWRSTSTPPHQWKFIRRNGFSVFFWQAIKPWHWGTLNSKWFRFIENGGIPIIPCINTYDGSLFRCKLKLILAIQWQTKTFQSTFFHQAINHILIPRWKKIMKFTGWLEICNRMKLVYFFPSHVHGWNVHRMVVYHLLQIFQ